MRPVTAENDDNPPYGEIYIHQEYPFLLSNDFPIGDRWAARLGAHTITVAGHYKQNVVMPKREGGARYTEGTRYEGEDRESDMEFGNVFFHDEFKNDNRSVFFIAEEERMIRGPSGCGGKQGSKAFDASRLVVSSNGKRMILYDLSTGTVTFVAAP